jgi:hypothetical protein
VNGLQRHTVLKGDVTLIRWYMAFS